MNRYVWVLSFAVLLGVVTPRAGGQETLSDVGLGWQTLFTVVDVDVIDKAAKLTSEQRQAIEDLMQAAMAKAIDQRFVLNEQTRKVYDTVGDGEQPEKVAAAGKQYAAAKRAFRDAMVPIERDTLRDIRDLLTSDQSEKAWTGYERYRRSRVILSWVPIDKHGHGLAPRELLKRLKLSESDAEATGAILDEAEPGLDVSVRRLMDAARAASKADEDNPETLGRKLIELSPEDDSNPSEVRRNLKKAQSEVAAEYLRLCTRLAGRLSPEGRRMLQHKRIEIENFEYTLSRSWASMRDKASSYAQTCKTLTIEQKRALKDLSSTATGQIRDLLVPDLASRDAAMLKGDKWTPDEKRVAAFSDAAQKIRKQLDKDAQSVLTPEQISEVDYRRPSPAKLRKMFYSTGERGIYGTDEDE